MVQAIIFDLYGVLAINGWQSFKAKHFSDREDLWDQVFRIGKQVDTGVSDYEELVRFTAEASGQSEATVRYQLEHTVANEELLRFIHDDLKGQYKLGILSNAGDDEVLDRIFTPEQRSLFDAITLSREIGIPKPDPRTYNFIADALSVPTGDCIFIDDQERHTAGAREAGMQSILFTDVTELKAALVTLP
jgi:FMN phosphatase YigB (HAD superfamily)